MNYFGERWWETDIETPRAEIVAEAIAAHKFVGATCSCGAEWSAAHQAQEVVTALDRIRSEERWLVEHMRRADYERREVVSRQIMDVPIWGKPRGGFLAWLGFGSRTAPRDPERVRHDAARLALGLSRTHWYDEDEV